MPGTTWNIIALNSKGLSAQINENFDWIEGTFLPFYQGSETTSVYTLGNTATTWRTGYFATSIMLGALTITSADDVTLGITSGALTIKAEGVRGATANSGGSQREIAIGTISTPDMRTNALKNYTTSCAGAGDGSGSAQNTASVTTIGGAVLIVSEISGIVNTTTSETFMSVERDGTQIVGGKLVHSDDRAHPSLRLVCVDTPAAGGHTYIQRQSNIATVESSHFTVIEVRA